MKSGNYTVGHGDHRVSIAAHEEGGQVFADVNYEDGWFECQQGQLLGTLESVGGDIALTWEENDGQAAFWPAED